MKICRGAEYFYVAALSILAKSVTTFSSFLRFAFTKKVERERDSWNWKYCFSARQKNIILPFSPFCYRVKNCLLCSDNYKQWLRVAKNKRLQRRGQEMKKKYDSFLTFMFDTDLILKGFPPTLCFLNAFSIFLIFYFSQVKIDGILLFMCNIMKKDCFTKCSTIWSKFLFIFSLQNV